MANSEQIFKIKQEITQIRLKNQECRDRLIHLGELIDDFEKSEAKRIKEIESQSKYGCDSVLHRTIPHRTIPPADCLICQSSCAIEGRTEIFCTSKQASIREGNFTGFCFAFKPKTVYFK